MSETMKAIGEFFREYRLQSEMEPDFVVQELGLVGLTQLFEYEAGTAQIPLEDLFAMANLYNIQPDVVVRLLYDLSTSGRKILSKANA
jgi:hypothetical protein